MSLPPDQIAESEVVREAVPEKGLPLTVSGVPCSRKYLSMDHPTADQILDAVKERVPGISRTTVYRSLETLADMGLIRRLHHAGASSRFDGKIHRHHHLICKVCGEVIDLEDQKLDQTRVSHIKNEGFDVEDFSVHLIGTCSECRQAAKQ